MTYGELGHLADPWIESWRLPAGPARKTELGWVLFRQEELAEQELETCSPLILELHRRPPSAETRAVLGVGALESRGTGETPARRARTEQRLEQAANGHTPVR